MRARFLLLLVLAALPSCFLVGGRARSNILLIVVDSLRFDAFSKSLGAPLTPNVQAIAADGMSYRGCYAQSSVTLPAHAAILSARLPSDSGVRNDGQAVDPEVTLLAEHLRDRGWQTFADVSTTDLVPVARDRGLDRGFGVFRTHAKAPADATEVNERILPLLRNADREKPWFTYVHFSDPARADELVGSAEITAKVFLDGAPIGTVRTNATEDWSVKIDIGPGPHRLEFRSSQSFNLRRFEIVSDKDRLTPEFQQGRLFAPLQQVVIAFANEHPTPITYRLQAQIRGVQSLAECRLRYKAQVEAVDRAIGEIVETLKATQQYENTVIVVTGSHGEALGEHGVTGHDITLYDEVLRVPLLIKPSVDEDRRVLLSRQQYALVRQIDIAPTLLELVGERALSGAEGLSLLREGQREMTAESHPPEAPSSILARRDDRYKLVFIEQENRFEMYDVKSDTLEVENIFPLQGQFRTKWQLELRHLAESAPHFADSRTKFAPVIPVGEQAEGPQSARN